MPATTGKSTTKHPTRRHGGAHRPAKSHGPAKKAHGPAKTMHVPAKVSYIAVPAASAALGVAGGVAIGRTTAHRGRQVLGIRVPISVVLLWGVAKELRAANRQVGRLTGGARDAGRRMQRIGHAFG